MSAPLDLTRAPAHDPLGLYRFRDGLYAVDLIAAAITEFDLFTKLAAKPSDLGTVCRDLGTHRRPTDVMLTLFAANGFLALKDGVAANSEYIQGRWDLIGEFQDVILERIEK